MKANELRIGNWVEVENYKNIQLENVHPKGTTRGDDQYLISMLNPIPLTEEILLKCGFKYREAMAGGQDEWAGYGFWSLNGVHLLGHKNGEVLYYDRRSEVEYKYLHQLQNLYFALTNEELQIELL